VMILAHGGFPCLIKVMHKGSQIAISTLGVSRSGHIYWWDSEPSASHWRVELFTGLSLWR
jgi:hypothetical protein